MNGSLLLAKHKSFFEQCLKGFPDAYATLDTSRLTLLFFCLSGLDLVGAVETLSEERRKELIRWIYSCQLTTAQGLEPNKCGFTGSPAQESTVRGSRGSYISGHLAMTYSALSCLLILQDDFSGLDRQGIIAGVRSCQLPDGSFCAHPSGSENDGRFVYCAAAVCYALQDWTGIDIERTIKFLDSCLSYEGAFGQLPSLESHGGSTYCAIATLSLLGKLDTESSILSGAKRLKLRRWCLSRQNGGFHGRANKPDDSCYSFWIGASLSMLGSLSMIDREKVREFTLSTQDSRLGGFGKYSDSFPDALHSYLSLAGLSLLNEPGLATLDPALNISGRAAAHLASLRPSLPPPPPSSCCAGT